MPIYHCFECGRLTEHLNVLRAAKRAGVSRGTAYRWIRRSLVHSLLHPSGRIFVCADSLLTPGFARFPGERQEAVPWTVAEGDINPRQLARAPIDEAKVELATHGAAPAPPS